MGENGVTVVVRNFSYWPYGKKKATSQPILKDVSFLASPGRLVGVFGPSGGGKTTLLNAVGSRVCRGKAEGSIDYIAHCANNDEQSVSEPKVNGKLISFVMSQDQFSPGLTVEETLHYAAELKLAKLPAEERAKRVAKVMNDFGLADIRHMRVQSNQKLNFGNSKRLSLAIELLDESPIVICDEPTSGLDTALTLDIITELRKAAKIGNRTVICSIHQPRTKVFNLFDDVLLLSEGCLVYFGPPGSLSSYLDAEVGLRCPPLWAPADFALEVVAKASTFSRVELDDSSTPVTITQPTKEVMENYRPPVPHLSIDILKETFSKSQLNRTLAGEIDSACQGNLGRVLRPTVDTKLSLIGWCNQMWILMKRQFLSRRRDPLSWLLLLLINLAQGIIIGSIFWQMPNYVKGIRPIQIASLSQKIIPWGNPWFDSLIYGIDGQGYQPILETIGYGVDGNGRSVMDTIFLNKEVQAKAVHSIRYLFQHLNISDQGYPNFDWLDAIRQNGGDSPTDVQRTEVEDDEEELPDDDYEFPPGDDDVLSRMEVSNYVKLGVQALQIVDSLYYKVKWNELKRCETVLSDKKAPLMYYWCLFSETSRLTTIEIEELLGIETLVSVFCYVVDCKEAVPESHGPSKRELASDTKRFSFTWEDLMNLDEDRIVEFSDRYGLTSWMEQHIGREPLSLIAPIQEYIRRLSGCVHPFCNFVKASSQPLPQIFETLVGFVLDTYITLGTMFNISGVLFFTNIFFGLASYDTLLTFSKTRLLFNKETASGLYYPSSYYVAKSLADLPFQAIPCLALAVILYFIVGLNQIGAHPVQQFLIYLVLSLLITFAAYGFSYMISALCSSFEMAMILSSSILMVWLTISGFFMRDTDLPNWIIWFKYASFYRWGFFGFLANLFRPGEYFGNVPNEINLSFCGIVDTRIWYSCMWLLIASFVYRILGFVFLKFFHRNVGLES